MYIQHITDHSITIFKFLTRPNIGFSYYPPSLSLLIWSDDGLKFRVVFLVFLWFLWMKRENERIDASSKDKRDVLKWTYKFLKIKLSTLKREKTDFHSLSSHCLTGRRGNNFILSIVSRFERLFPSKNIYPLVCSSSTIPSLFPMWEIKLGKNRIDEKYRYLDCILDDIYLRSSFFFRVFIYFPSLLLPYHYTAF